MTSIPSLELLTREPHYSQCQNLLRQRRAAFKANSKAQIDLDAYKRGDHSHKYTELKGLIPEQLVQNASGGVPYGRSDTFFTDYEKHHPAEHILSSTNHSLIIGNRSSHDVRQYSAEWDPDHKDRTSSAGMSYFHFMVIPIHKVYNVVSLEDTAIIEEMIQHFRDFWSRPDAVQKCNARIQFAIDERAKDVIKSLRQNAETAPARIHAFEAVMRDIQITTNDFSVMLKSLTAADFVFGFHAMPDASVGHLHMHVLSAPPEFRRYSTFAHDWKTIPAQAVIEVIQQEKAPQNVGAR